jgi:hypothetical protein
MSEQTDHEAIARFLDIALPLGAWHTAIDSSSKSSRIAGALLKARGGKRGTPDHVILWRGRNIWFEIKTAIGKLSKWQKRVRDDIIAAGGLWFCVRSVEQAEAALLSVQMPLRARVTA